MAALLTLEYSGPRPGLVIQGVRDRLDALTRDFLSQATAIVQEQIVDAIHATPWKWPRG